MEPSTGAQQPQSPTPPQTPPQPQAAPAHDPSVVYLQPGQRAVYIQPGMTPPVNAPAPAVPAEAPWFYANQYTPQMHKGPSSGLRIASGVVGIALGAWNTLTFFAIMSNVYGPKTPLFGWMNFFHLVGTIAILTLGIMIIVKHRQRSRPIPAMLLGFTFVTVIVDLILSNAYWMPGVMWSLYGGIPLMVLTLLVLILENSAARKQ
ncbi:hypothetical protein [Arthrobacter caoxuetaonis]|uniref:Uncharacterized protein n=1 Tax=Arthrobacter caoxuetaonis TaxID=2886935 RepID=A0A9X1SDL2_9MICC|nr:hypothetical protein [Arthrobacter caoxuetaonis]MCC3299785.1 hypothetical protein [Arthrobacter caoxuetaonis]USQ59314.1 hypothetical protein NF551_17170 [Arthrobacter caoxuetaonis]